jgi:hypothetical protein
MSDWYARRLARARTQAPVGGQVPAPRPAYQQQRPPPGYIPQPDHTSAPVTIDNLWGAMQVWRGGKAHKVDPDPCPQCGSNQYFSRTGSEIRRGPPPAPHCFSCGYNGMFEQGLASSWNA